MDARNQVGVRKGAPTRVSVLLQSTQAEACATLLIQFNGWLAAHEADDVEEYALGERSACGYVAAIVEDDDASIIAGDECGE